jgi:hypothetical protein
MEYFPSLPSNTFKICILRYYMNIVIIMQTGAGRGCDRMVVGFTTTYAMIVYHH